MVNVEDDREPIERGVLRVAGPVLIAVAATAATLLPEVGGSEITCDELYHQTGQIEGRLPRGRGGGYDEVHG